MQKLETLKLSCFRNLQSIQSVPRGIDEMMRLLVYDQQVEWDTINYRKMMVGISKEKADFNLKQKKLPAFSIAVLFDGNGKTDYYIQSFTGLALVDIDHIGNPGEVFAKVKADPHTLIAYKTLSDQGLRIVYRYTRESDAAVINAVSWPAAFKKGNDYYAQLTGLAYDKRCSDYTRLCGLAHDPDAYVNMQAVPFVITDDEITDSNVNKYMEGGRPRREYKPGACKAAVEQAWPRVEAMMQAKGMTYQSHHHHDYILHAACLMNYFGVDKDKLSEWADQHWSDYNASERQRVIDYCYMRTEQHGIWKLGAAASNSGKGQTNSLLMPDIIAWMRSHYTGKYDLVADQVLIHALKPDCRACEGSSDWVRVDDRVLAILRAELEQDTGKHVGRNDLADVLRSDFAITFHPVRNYINSLPAWDGTDRVAQLAAYVKTMVPDTLAIRQRQGDDKARRKAEKAQRDEQQLFEWALHKWLVASVGMWMDDRTINHEVLVLIGSQGIYKTTFFRHLLPPAMRDYFWENTTNSLDTKDDRLALTVNCLVEIEEIDMRNDRSVSQLKALATSDKIKERPPYGRYVTERKRMASFCGSGNVEHFLNDETGTRRWLCFKVETIDDPHAWDLDYTQLFAQLRDELRQGFCHYFTPQDQRRIEKHNEAFCVESDEEQLIRSHLRKPMPTEKAQWLNSTAIAKLLNGGTVGRALSSRRIGLIMKRLGFEWAHRRAGNVYKVYVIPPNEMQANAAMADDFTPAPADGYHDAAAENHPDAAADEPVLPF